MGSQNKIVAVPGLGNVQFPADMADVDINAAIEQELSKKNPKPVPQQLLNAPNQPGLQPTTSAMDIFKNMASDAYGSTVPGMMSNVAKVGQMYLTQKANQRQHQNEVAVAQGQAPPNNPAATTAMRMGADTSGFVSQANSPTGLAVAGATVAAPVAAGVGMVGYGGYKAYQNKDALIDLLTKGQANPQQVQEGLMGLSTMAAGGSMAGGVLSPAKAPYKPTAETPDVARIVTDTVNPSPKTMTAFENNVRAQLPEVVQGKQIGSRAELAKAFKDTADQSKQSYYDTYINPLKDVPTSSGRTIGQLDARLGEINATLKPTYEKGGATAQAALSAENKAQLTAEAAKIRSDMNTAIGQKLNVPPEQVAAGRQKFGQMYDIADKINIALNKERYVTNAANKEPISLDSSATGVALRAASKFKDSKYGLPAERALQDALRNYSPTAPNAGVPPVMQPNIPPQLTPAQRAAMMQAIMNRSQR